MKKTVIIVAGPTGVGKTSMAIRLARHFRAGIISADSRQCYRELNIGVARPTPEQLAAAPHHFIATHSIHHPVTAAGFEQYALATAEQLFSDNDTVLMCGGTGLYIRAFTDGLDAIPKIPAETRASVAQGYASGGLGWLTDRLKIMDPLFAAGNMMLNPHRMIRALEVVSSTGNSILHYQHHQPAQRPFRMIRIAMGLPRPELNQRIDARVEQMMKEGLLAEAESLRPYRGLNPLQTVGYQELFSIGEKYATLAQAVAAIAQHTRQYAKRQVTWFNKEPAWQWFRPDDTDQVIRYINENR